MGTLASEMCDLQKVKTGHSEFKIWQIIKYLEEEEEEEEEGGGGGGRRRRKMMMMIMMMMMQTNSKGIQDWAQLVGKSEPLGIVQEI